MLNLFTKWLTPNIGIKRWLLMFVVGMVCFSIGLALALLKIVNITALVEIPEATDWTLILVMLILGGLITLISMRRIVMNVLAPYQQHQQRDLVDLMMDYRRRQKGVKFVAIGGGTGLPASLRAMKPYTSNITAIVTVADDGGSSGRLRRDLGVLPPGDLRNNIAALADDESLLTRLFQYRFEGGDLHGHSFGNLFIAALTNIVADGNGNRRNSLAEALVEVERVLNIQGRVLPATLDDVSLSAVIKLSGSARLIKVRGESQISEVNGTMETIQLVPEDAQAFGPTIQAIRDADLIVIGPGSLYTSILPNLMVKGIADALRASDAYKIYICNVATQPVETEDYTVAEHVMALEKHIGRGVFQAVIANNVYPRENAGQNTFYVRPAPSHHEIYQRYEIMYTDLTDSGRPWRHDPYKLAQAILELANLDAKYIIPIIKSAV